MLQNNISRRVWWYQSGNQNRISKKNRQHNGQKEKYKRTRRVWRYQRGNQNPYIEEEQTTQWLKEKVQKDKQRSTKHTHKAKDWVTWTLLKIGGDLSFKVRDIFFVLIDRNTTYKWDIHGGSYLTYRILTILK